MVGCWFYKGAYRGPTEMGVSVNKNQPILKIGTIEERFNGSLRPHGWVWNFNTPRMFLTHEIRDGVELWCGWTIAELLEISESGIIPAVPEEFEYAGDIGP